MLTATAPYKITEEPWVVDSSSSMIKWGGAAYRRRCDDADLNDNAITCGYRAIKRLRKVRKVRGTNVGVQFKPMHRSYGTTKMGDTRFANLKLRTSHKLFWRDMFAAVFFRSRTCCVSFHPLNPQDWNDEMVWTGREKIAKWKRLSHDF